MSEFEKFCEGVSRLLSRPLPGNAAQARMAPSHRSGYKPATSDVREGAVMILLFPAEDGISTLFTVRRKDLADHAGQISFPGGKREDGESFEEAALRESEEEIGIPRSHIDVLGRLSTLYIPPTRFMVHPFIGVLSGVPMVVIDEREVDSVIEVTLQRLQDPSTQQSEEWTIRGQPSIVPFFRVDEHVIWGATAMITAELLQLLSEAGLSNV